MYNCPNSIIKYYMYNCPNSIIKYYMYNCPNSIIKYYIKFIIYNINNILYMGICIKYTNNIL